MPPMPAKLFRPEDLDDVDGTTGLPDDLPALRATADWIANFVGRSHPDLGRTGPVCPFVPWASQRGTLWLAPERLADRSLADVVDLVRGYRTVFLEAPPVDGDDADHKAIAILFGDLPADRAADLFDAVLQQLAMAAYAEDGLVMGSFHPGATGAAIYNPDFQPFRSPAPFLLIRRAVVSDWKFFLDKPDWLALWARRHGEAAINVLAEELRRLPWRLRRG